MNEAQRIKLLGNLHEMQDWLESYECDVDHQSFKNESYKLLRSAFPVGRMPTIPLGMISYEVAAAVAGRVIPMRIIRDAARTGLPGAKELRAQCSAAESDMKILR